MSPNCVGLGIMEYVIVLHLEMWCKNTGEYYNGFYFPFLK